MSHACTSELHEALKVLLHAHATLSTFAAAMNIRTLISLSSVRPPGTSLYRFPRLLSHCLLIGPDPFKTKNNTCFAYRQPVSNITFSPQKRVRGRISSRSGRIIRIDGDLLDSDSRRGCDLARSYVTPTPLGRTGSPDFERNLDPAHEPVR